MNHFYILGSSDLCLGVEKVLKTYNELSLCNSVTFLVDRGVFNAKEMQRHVKVFCLVSLIGDFIQVKVIYKNLFTDVDKSYYKVWWIKKNY